MLSSVRNAPPEVPRAAPGMPIAQLVVLVSFVPSVGGAGSICDEVEYQWSFPLPSVFSGPTIARMPSKQVTDRQKSARAVAATAETHAQQAASQIQQLLAPYLQSGENFPDLSVFLRLVGRHVASENELLVNADIAHERELSDDAAPRQARDDTAEKVREILLDLRSSVEATYGPPGLHTVGLADAVPVDPSVIAATGRAALVALKDTANAFPIPRHTRLALDRKAFVDDLEAALPPLEVALAAVAKEAREAEVTLSEKRRAMDSNDRAFRRGASTLSVLFALGGLEDAASKVRPSGRKPGQTLDAEEPEASAEAP